MSGPHPVLDRLRAATAPAHQILDAQLGVVERLGSLSTRRDLVARYHRMHASADRGLAIWLEPLAGLDYVERRRAPLLAKDLTALGLPAPSMTTLPPLAVSTLPEALGVLYVLEGSTLGGHVIQKALKTRQGDLTGLGFLDPYGAQTGERWRGFLAVLEREGARDPAGIERGGLLGFEHAHACLMDLETLS